MMQKHSVALGSISVQIAIGAAILAGALPGAAWGQAQIDEDGLSRTFHVDAGSPAASDGNDGSEAAPLKTISKGLDLAMQAGIQNVGTRVLVYPGVYRESLELRGNRQRTAAPLVLEAKQRGTAIIEGADRWNDWTRLEDSDIYVHPWTYKFKMWDIPPGWEGVTVREIVRRQEMILADGTLLRQVLSPAELKEGTYLVSEQKQKVYLNPPKGVDPAKALIEVAVRRGVDISNRANVVMRGLVIQHTTDTLGTSPSDGGLRVSGCDNVLIEDVLAQWNNTGTSFGDCEGLTVRRVAANHNGSTGSNGWKLTNVLFEDTETSYNNWRGHWGDFTGWSVAGLKHMMVRNVVYRRHRSVGNQTGGFWLDFDNQNVLVDGAYWADNLTEGVFIEANQGPITLKNSTICFNGGTGVLSTNSERITLENNVLYGNGGAQLTLTGIEDRPVSDYTTGETRQIKMRQWTLKDNLFGEYLSADPLIDISYPAEPLLTTLSASGNLYSTKDSDHLKAKAFRLTGMNLSLPEWQAVTGQDMASLVADARLTDPQNRNFDPRPESPLKDRAHWPVSTVKFTGISASRERMLQMIKENWARPYSLAAAPAAQFRPLDLASYANRSLLGPDAGIAGPVEHLAAGQQKIHGVPFHVIDQQQNHGVAAIVLRSSQLSKSLGQLLPADVLVTVGTRAKAIYLLHGAGYAGEHTKIGAYTFIYEDGTEVALNIVPLGPGAKDMDLVKKVENESSVADWWPTAPQFESDNARKVIVASESDPLRNVRYLYTLQWQNPHPDKVIKAIRFASDPSQQGTLMVLSATLLQEGT